MLNSMPLRPSRRWPRFSLRMLFVLVTVFCVWLAREASFVHKRKSAIAEINAAGGDVVVYKTRGPRFPFWRYWMGDAAVDAVVIEEKEARKMGFDRIDEIWAVIPEADVNIDYLDTYMDVNHISEFAGE